MGGRRPKRSAREPSPPKNRHRHGRRSPRLARGWSTADQPARTQRRRRGGEGRREAGQGFAVVASEVRSLAQRSSQAAKDIKDLITNSNSQVKDGVDLVNKAGRSLQRDRGVDQEGGDHRRRHLQCQHGAVERHRAGHAATAKTLEQQAKSMDERVAAFRYAPTRRARPPKPAPKRAAPKPAPKRAVNGDGPVGRMQTALATAIESR